MMLLVPNPFKGLPRGQSSERLTMPIAAVDQNYLLVLSRDLLRRSDGNADDRPQAASQAYRELGDTTRDNKRRDAWSAARFGSKIADEMWPIIKTLITR
jgi:hypothetical protein